MSSSYKVIELCESLGIKRQNYYYKAHPRQIPESQIKAVKRVFLESHRAYGAEKITKQLQRDGINIAETVSKIMREGRTKYIKSEKMFKSNKSR